MPAAWNGKEHCWSWSVKTGKSGVQTLWQNREAGNRHRGPVSSFCISYQVLSAVITGLQHPGNLIGLQGCSLDGIALTGRIADDVELRPTADQLIIERGNGLRTGCDDNGICIDGADHASVVNLNPISTDADSIGRGHDLCSMVDQKLIEHLMHIVGQLLVGSNRLVLFNQSNILTGFCQVISNFTADTAAADDGNLFSDLCFAGHDINRTDDIGSIGAGKRGGSIDRSGSQNDDIGTQILDAVGTELAVGVDLYSKFFKLTLIPLVQLLYAALEGLAADLQHVSTKLAVLIINGNLMTGTRCGVSSNQTCYSTADNGNFLRRSSLRDTVTPLTHGGGVAGMQAALTAFEAGHDVSLYEASDVLGGHLNEAGSHPFKYGIADLNKWYQRQLKKNGIPVYLNSPMDAEKIKALKPDVAILSVGSYHFIPPIPGHDHEKSVLCYDVLMGQKKVGQKVVVVGGGLTGSELAYDLAAYEGKDVTVVEGLPDILSAGAPVQKSVNMMLRDLLDYNHVKLVTNTFISEVSDEGAVVLDRATNTKYTIPADNVVFAIGLKPNKSLAHDLLGSGIEVHEVGDGKQVANIRVSTSEAYEVARKL